MSLHPVRWAIIGCGDVARKRVAAAIQNCPDAELALVCRRNSTQLAQFADEFQVPRTATVAEEVLQDPEIDAVYLATPNDLHRPHTLLAAECGKHVLVEKPMALTVDECQQMVDACRAHQVTLGVAYYRRFYPIVDRMRQLIEDGTIGQPLAVSATTATPFAIDPGEDGFWRVEPAGGGGVLMDIGSHRLNLFWHLFGHAREVKSVASTVVRDYPAENAASVSLRFESGVIGSLQCFFESTIDPDEFWVLGTNGRLSAAPLNGDTLVIQTSDETRTEYLPPHANFNQPQIADFVQAIREARQPRVDGREGLETNRLLAACYSSLAID